jgi:hypothetical protein
MKYLSWDENRPCVLGYRCFAPARFVDVSQDIRARRDH